MSFKAFLNLFAKQGGSADFGRSIRAAARILWKDPTDLVGFVDALESAITIGYERAWKEGAAACGVLPGDRTPEEVQELRRFIHVAQTSILSLSQFIADNSQPNGGLWRDLQSRLDIWIKRYNEVRERAKGMACANRKAEWFYGDTIDHCTDCSKVVGRVYRLSIWDKYGWIPGSRALDCGGWRCDCRRRPTDKPVTPGRPPSLSGGGII